jgi:hypothetical protein
VAANPSDARIALSSGPIKPGVFSQTQPLLQFFVRDILSQFGFGSQNTGSAFFIYFFFRSLPEAAAELLIVDGLPTFRKSEERVNLTRRQGSMIS